MSVKYDDSSIDRLIGADRVRKRPEAMLGSSGIDGAKHGFEELYGNALDEHGDGYGDKFDIKRYSDGSLSLRDYGRGVPLGWNDKSTVKNWNWHVIYNDLYGGGKYNTNQKELSLIQDWRQFNAKKFRYLYAVGLNGLGGAATQYTSEYFIVKSYRGGRCTSRSFKKGMPLVNGEPFDMFSATPEQVALIPEEIEDTAEPNGTFIRWKPDPEVFSDTNITADWLLETCKDIANVCGIEINFEDESTGQEVTIPAGTLADALKDHAGSNITSEDGIYSANAFDHGTIEVEGKPFIWVCQCDLVFVFTDSEVPVSCYHNSVKKRIGVQYDAVYDAINVFMSEVCKQRGIKIDKRDYAGTITAVVSTKSNYASNRGQTKDGVDDAFIFGIIKRCLLEKLRLEYGKGNEYIEAIIQKAIEEANFRREQEALRVLAKAAVKVKREKAPIKFVSCDAYEEKRYKDVELWLTEGDSAAGEVKKARSAVYQALYPLKGKGLNVAKASIEKILSNNEIRELFAILGTGLDIHIDGEKLFDINDLKVGKIIFGTDADVDGFHIRVLLFLIFYLYAPKLIQAGIIFIAETPRFGIELNDGTMLYARDDKMRDSIVEEYGSSILRISRYKGLGELPAHILRETTVDPRTRTLVPIDCDFANQLEVDLIDALFGADKFGQRKAIVSAILGVDVTDIMEDDALELFDDEEEFDDGIEYERVEF